MTSNGVPGTPSGDWKSRTYLTGGLIGLAIGLISAYLYVRVSDEHGLEAPSQIKTMDLIGLSVALLGVVRQITDLGTKTSK